MTLVLTIVGTAVTVVPDMRTVKDTVTTMVMQEITKVGAEAEAVADMRKEGLMIEEDTMTDATERAAR
jgi:hypothetical protein